MLFNLSSFSLQPSAAMLWACKTVPSQMMPSQLPVHGLTRLLQNTAGEDDLWIVPRLWALVFISCWQYFFKWRIEALPLKEQVHSLRELLDPNLLLDNKGALVARNTFYNLWVVSWSFLPFVDRKDLAVVVCILITSRIHCCKMWDCPWAVYRNFSCPKCCRTWCWLEWDIGTISL